MATVSKGPQCFAYRCTNYRNKYSREKGITFHRFPLKENKPELYASWVRNSHRDRKPTQYSLLCSDHFEVEVFDRTGQTVRLREGAIPTLFSLPPHLQISKPHTRTTKNSCKTIGDNTKEEQEFPHANNNNNNIMLDHGYFGSPQIWKRKLDVTESQLDHCKKKLKNALKREQRAKKNSKDYIEELYEKNLINMELKMKLHSFGDLPTHLFQRPTKEYSEYQKDFSLTLHLQSPKAYDYLRTQEKFPLPCPRTLRKWMENVDCKPGINLSLIKALALKKEKNPEEYTRCCLILDAMSIRQHIDYNQHEGTYMGYVDLGNGQEEIEAKEVLVFLLVGLVGSWKAPIAYFFTRGLTAECQKVLLTDCIHSLADYNFEVHAITMDGHTTNMSMCTLLGATFNVFNDTQTYVKPCEKQDYNTYIFPDACHMVKLMRNMLHAYGNIQSSDGTISWQYIEKLHLSQEKAGLRLGNKLSKKHIEFGQQKMKVNLAVQLISSSVANGLRSMKLMEYKDFQECDATANFLEIYVC